MKTFNEWLNEQGYDSWKLASPDDWEAASWSPDDLEWTEWEDDSEAVYLKNDKLFDSKSKELVWLTPILKDLLNQSTGKDNEKYWLEFEIKFGDHKVENERLALDVKNVKMTSEHGNGIQTSFDLEKFAGKIGKHFYPKLKFI